LVENDIRPVDVVTHPIYGRSFFDLEREAAEGKTAAGTDNGESAFAENHLKMDQQVLKVPATLE
jgi:hypothetical protein